MGSGFGLSRMVQGAVGGMNQAESRRDRESNREYRDTTRERETEQFDQSQDDREYALRRRDIETSRADEEFARVDGNRQRKVKVNDALKSWMMDGDLTNMIGVANEYGVEGVTYDITKNDDGTYTRSMKGPQGEESEVVDDDALGQGLMMFSDDDFAGSLRQKQAKSSERNFDMSKLEKEYELKRGLERVKGSYKEGGGLSRGGKSLPAYSKELARLSSERYGGKLANGEWTFDTTRKKGQAATHSDLASAYYLSGDGDTNAAHRQAGRAVIQLEDRATEQADMELDSGAIDKKEYEARVVELMDSYADIVIGRMSPKPGQMSRGGQAGTQSGEMGDAGDGTPSWEDYLERGLEKARGYGMDEDQAMKELRADYEKKFGTPPAPDEGVAPELQRDGGTTADSGGVPGIKDAMAGEDADVAAANKASEEAAAAEQDAATEEARRQEQRSGIKPETLKRVSKKKAAENKEKRNEAGLSRNRKKAKGEQKTQLRRYRKLKSTARSKIMSKKQLSLALQAAESKKERDDIVRLLKQKAESDKKGQPAPGEDGAVSLGRGN